MRGESGSSNGAFESHIPPFLAWAGGKHHLVKRFLAFLPGDLEQRTYREPFLGAGSFFFTLRPTRAFLSDANTHLISCYEYVRDNPGRVADCLTQHGSKSTREYYYRVRNEYNGCSFSNAQAARFIYLNKACFNGIFRVNRKGMFNVPFGRKKRLVLPSRTLLKEASRALCQATLSATPFDTALQAASSGDFIYLDPPYPPLNGSSFFRHYTTDRFQIADHRQLAEWVRELNTRGCLIMLSNADIPAIRQLYRGFNITALSVTRYVTCKATKHRVRELIVTNYRRKEWPSD